MQLLPQICQDALWPVFRQPTACRVLPDVLRLLLVSLEDSTAGEKLCIALLADTEMHATQPYASPADQQLYASQAARALSAYACKLMNKR